MHAHADVRHAVTRAQTRIEDVAVRIRTQPMLPETIKACAAYAKQRPKRQWHRGKGVLEPSGSVVCSNNEGFNMQGASQNPLPLLRCPAGRS